MPFFRSPALGVIHIKGRNLPKPCGEAIGVLTSDGRPMQICGDFSRYLCDGPGIGRATCDRPLCDAHAAQTGPNKHLCPGCRTAAIDDAGQRSLFTHLITL